MNNLTGWMENRLVPIGLKIGNIRVFKVIQSSMMASMALLIVGSIAMLLANIPYEPIANFIEPANTLLYTISGCTTGILALSIAASIGYYGAEEYKVTKFSTALVAVAAFIVTQYNLETGINMSGLGTTGILTAILVGFSTVGIVYLFKKYNITIKMPDSVPPAVGESFSSLLPSIVVVAFWGIICVALGVDVNSVASTVASPLANFINTPWGFALFEMLGGLFFFCGIHSAVIGSTIMPLILANSAANEVAIASGQAPIYASTMGTEMIICTGGTGALFGLMLLMSFFAKSQHFKTLGRMSIVPGMFNINEPVIFGTPICFNPIFLIPFVAFPGFVAFTTHVLMTSGIIAMPIVTAVPWTLPSFVAAFFMTGGAWSTTIWAFIVALLSIVVYYPFFKIADAQQYKEELAENQ